MLFVLSLVGIAVVAFLVLAISLYRVVEPNKAHVLVVAGGGRKVYHPAKDGSKSAYFFIPILMKRIIVSLENVKHEINEIILHDSEMAPFSCDITCWFKITNPDLAAEKLDVDDDGSVMASIRETLNAQIQGVARASAMGQEVVGLMKDRTKFASDVFQTVNGDLDEWGVQLVKLEIIDFRDSTDSHVIQDYQDRRKSQVQSMTRQEVAKQNKEAEIAEADAKQLAGIKMAESDREIEKADIERKKQVAMASQEAEKKITEQVELVNAQKVKAKRTLDVGNAAVVKEATIEQAEGEAAAILKKGQAEADVTLAKGTADANVIEKTGVARATIIEKTGLAEATAKDKMAKALKEFNDAGITLEQIRGYVEIQKSKYENLGRALASANVNLVGGADGGNIMGFDLNAETGAGLAQMMQVFTKITGKDPVETVKEIASTIK